MPGAAGESTCGLTASTGFNACLDPGQGRDQDAATNASRERTSYAGMRACNSANPCRDDYICLRPMGYDQANGAEKFDAPGQKTVSYKSSDYGQQEPDAAWLARNGGRGDSARNLHPALFRLPVPLRRPSEPGGALAEPAAVRRSLTRLERPRNSVSDTDLSRPWKWPCQN